MHLFKRLFRRRPAPPAIEDLTPAAHACWQDAQQYMTKIGGEWRLIELKPGPGQPRRKR